jgi:predicted RNA polymerase sigma factor
MRETPITEVGTVGIPVADQDRALEFYVDTLGFEERRDIPFEGARWVEDAVVRALERWSRDGVPDNPRAWLTVTAKRRAIDLVRREARRAGKEAEAVSLLGPVPEPAEVVRDDMLRLDHGQAAHPRQAEDRARSDPYRVPTAEELPGRLAAVAATVYLIFNARYAAGAGTDLVRVALTDEAVRLARLLAELMPDEPTALGLLALLLHDARRAARLDDHERPVLLPGQDRSRWDSAEITEGVELVGAALRRTPDRPDTYVVQAAIVACHTLLFAPPSVFH